jgi:hypothetical protein
MKKNILTSIGLTVFFAVGIMSLNVVLDSNSSSVHAFTGGSDGGRTNSPGDIANVAVGQTANCTNCHSGTINSGVATRSITSTVPASGYISGTTYTITGTISQVGITKFGFEITAEKDSDNSKVGTISITDGTNTKSLGGTSVTHKNVGTTGAGSNTWSFDWVAPAVGTGDVTFYGAFNATNGTGTGQGNNTGDNVYTATPLSISEAITNSLAEQSNVVSTTIFPNPVKTTFEVSTNETIDNVVVYNITGKRMKDLKQTVNKFDATDLPSGIYFVQIISEGNLITRKIIKD